VTKSQQSREKVINAMMDRVKADQFTERLRSDTFWGLYLQLADILMHLGEPFVTVGTPDQPHEFNLPLYLRRRHKNNRSHVEQEPKSLSDLPAFIEKRKAAMVQTGPLLAQWEKAGIPFDKIWDVLMKIDPAKKREFAVLTRVHKELIYSVEVQKSICQQMAHAASPDVKLIVLSEDLRGRIVGEAAKAVERCNHALTKLAEADPGGPGAGLDHLAGH